MYNYFMLIGYVSNDPEIRETSMGTKVVELFIKIRRDFKTPEGKYTYDIIKVSVWEALADTAVERLKKGSKVVLKGRIRPNKVTLASGATIIINDLFADKLIDFSEYSFSEFDELTENEKEETDAE